MKINVKTLEKEREKFINAFCKVSKESTLNNNELCSIFNILINLGYTRAIFSPRKRVNDLNRLELVTRCRQLIVEKKKIYDLFTSEKIKCNTQNQKFNQKHKDILNENLRLKKALTNIQALINKNDTTLEDTIAYTITRFINEGFRDNGL